MVTSETEIGCLALAKIGGPRIVNINDGGDPHARAVRLHYDSCRDEVLRRAMWGFATKRTKLSRLSTPPAFEFSAQYALPADLVRFIEINGLGVWENESADWYAIEGGDDTMPNMILIEDKGETLPIKYIRRVEDVTKFDALFVNALVTLLASKIRPVITGDSGQSLLEEFEKLALPNARLLDGQESRQNAMDHPVFQRIRESGIHRAMRGFRF